MDTGLEISDLESVEYIKIDFLSSKFLGSGLLNGPDLIVKFVFSQCFDFFLNSTSWRSFSLFMAGNFCDTYLFGETKWKSF